MTASAGRRRRGRELALRVLFELEGTEKDPGDAIGYQAGELGATADVTGFATALVTGCLAHLDRVDDSIEGAADNWNLVDIGKVERAVLRLGTYELLEEPGTPVAVVIDEAVELANQFSTELSGRFVNGVLSTVAGRVRG